MNILDVRIDNLSKKEILEKIESFLDEPKFHQIATVNPEFVLEAQKNSEFKNILNSCDLNVADGVGIRLAFWRKGKKLKARVTGFRLMMEILNLAEKKNLKIFLAARQDGLSTWQETQEIILKIHPRLDVSGENIPCHPRVSGDPVSGYKVFTLDSRLPAGEAGFHGNDKVVVFCNFGAPHQELFLNSLKNDRIRLAMGVGGSFDFLTKKIKRAPAFLRKIGLEWFWRLILQPNRWKRIWNAVVIFPVRVIFGK